MGWRHSVVRSRGAGKCPEIRGQSVCGVGTADRPPIISLLMRLLHDRQLRCGQRGCLLPQGPISDLVRDRFNECPMLSASLVLLFPKILHLFLPHLASRIRALRALLRVPDPSMNSEVMASSVPGSLPDSSSPCHHRSCVPKGSQNSDLLKKDPGIALGRCQQMAQTEFWIQLLWRRLLCVLHSYLTVSHRRVDQRHGF